MAYPIDNAINECESEPTLSIKESDSENQFLKPGELIIAKKPTVVTTILGSCVTITFFNPRLQIGAICHAMQPTAPSNVEESDRFKYVDCSINHMLEKMHDFGLKTQEIDVKVFGGANMFSQQKTPNVLDIGKQNITSAIKTLENYKMRVVASNVLGKTGRKLLFHTHSGEVYLKRFNK